MAIRLWEEEVPLAIGGDPEDIPVLIPYLLESDKPVPCMIICPGGGYRRRAEHEGRPVAEWLNSIGISAFVLHYRVAPYQYPCAWLDGKRAVRLVRNFAKSYNIIRNRVGILGFSAGGHLASMVGTQYDNGNPDDGDQVERQSSRPDLMVLAYPVITFGEYRHAGSLTCLLGDNPEQELIIRLSSESQVTSDTPPAFLWHTADDAGVPVENSLLFAASLSRNKVPFELHIYEQGRHGLGLAEEVPNIKSWTKLCEQWLRKQQF